MVTEIETTKIGPGLFKLGDPALGAEVRLMSFTVSWSESVARTEARKVLSGAQTPVSEIATFTATGSGKVVQDIEDAAGVVAWSWEHKGTPQPCLYVPNNDVDRAVQGVISPIPLDFGGDVDADGPESDFTWRFIGEPILGTYDPIGDEFTPDF